MVRRTFARRLWFIATLFFLAFTAACGDSQSENGADAETGSPADLALETDQDGGQQDADSAPDLDAPTPLSISAGNRQACVLTPERDVQCWGANNFGQVGIGSSEGDDDVVTVDGLPPIAQVSAGGSHNCALSLEAEVWCWGNNEYGQLGSTVMPWSATPQRVEGLSNVVLVEVGGESVCALVSDGSVWCWGSNIDGELASTEIFSTHIPQRIESLPEIVQISGGARFYCVLDTEGGVWCWGNNTSGQIGLAPSDDVTAPFNVPGVPPAVDVSVGGGHSCVVLASKTVWCWGANEYGQLGTGIDSEFLPPSEATLLPSVELVTIAPRRTCVLLGDGEGVACLERTLDRVQDDGTVVLNPTALVPVSGSDRAIALDIHGAAVMVLDDGTVMAWGPAFAASHEVGQVDGTTAATGSQPTASVLQLSAQTTAPDAGDGAEAEPAEGAGGDAPQAIAIDLAEQYIQAVRDGDAAAIDALVSDDAVGDPMTDPPFDDPELACSEGSSVAFQWCSYLAEYGIIELTINVEQREISQTSIIYFGD